MERQNLQIQRGDDWSGIITVYLQDGVSEAPITGYTATSQIRQTASGSIMATISATVDSPHVNLAISHTDTASLLETRYTWDVQIVSPLGVVTTLMGGTVVVNEEITR